MTTNVPAQEGGGATMRRWLLFIGVSVIAGALGLIAARALQAPAQVPQIPGFLWPEPRSVPEFSLDGGDGQPFNLARLDKHWTFLFFGYTYCPDVCPTTLAQMREVMNTLREANAAEDVQVAFVSVDPARDTRDRLAEYVRYFDPAFLSASAADERLDAFTRALGAIYRIGEADENGNYEVDHTASVLLVDPLGRLVGIFGLPHDAKDIANRFSLIRRYVEEHA